MTDRRESEDASGARPSRAVDQARRAVARDRFAAFPADVRSAVRADEGGVAGAASVGATPGDECGPHEHIRHLIAVERAVWWSRFDELLAVPEPHWSWTEPGPDPTLVSVSLAELLDRFAADRAASVARLDAYRAADWDLAGVHDTFGRIDVERMLAIAADHDREHLEAITAAR